MVGEEEEEYWEETEDFLLFFTREYAREHYPYLVEDVASDEVFFFFKELALREMGVGVFQLALNPPRDILFITEGALCSILTRTSTARNV